MKSQQNRIELVTRPVLVQCHHRGHKRPGRVEVGCQVPSQKPEQEGFRQRPLAAASGVRVDFHVTKITLETDQGGG